ncbi:MAG: MBL fold metallo-hydrolase [Verrucomicrobiales bacterium]
MRYQHLARYPDIGSNSYLVELGKTKVVLDAGSHPKHTGKNTLPLFETIERGSVDAVFVSHSHLDHIGGLPVLVEQQPNAAVAMTEQTIEFGSALLHNSVNVMKSQRDELNERDYPLYTHRQIDRMQKDWLVRSVGKTFFIGEDDRVECDFFRAGHVMGAVGIRMRFEGKSILFTGDVHFEDQTMTRAADLPREKVDTLIIETTRGDHVRDVDYTREKEKRRFGETIARTLERGGAVLIPVFAFGKTQETLLMLHELRDEGVVPRVPVHIGGLSTRMTQIADGFCDYEGRLHREYRILADFEDLRVLPRGHREPEFHPGRIYALSSGMMSEKTVSHRFARRILASPENSLLFVGYADEATPGGRILEAGQGGRVRLDAKHEHETPIHCEVERFDFSGHAPREQLVRYALDCAPSTVLLVHGDPAAKEWFRNELSQKLPDAKVIVPDPGQKIDL